MDKLTKLECQRVECAQNLQFATRILNYAERAHENAKMSVEHAQRQVNHWQMKLDDTDNDIRREMEVMRNERGTET